MRVRFSQAGRSRHRIAPSRARHVTATSIGVPTTVPSGEPASLWIGVDQRGVVLEVIAVRKPTHLLVIHAMPHEWNRRKS